MDKIAVFPGSFDPVTRGHVSLIRRALPLFTKVVVAIGENPEKKAMFPLERRMEWLKTVFSSEPRVSIATFSGLTINFCREQKAGFILRGLRTAGDLEFERSIAQMNRYMAAGVDTVFLLSEPELVPVTSSLVRDIIRNGGDVRQFIPEGILL
jgi:pantetheine-phosphate adenylyltransferase